MANLEKMEMVGDGMVNNGMMGNNMIAETKINLAQEAVDMLQSKRNKLVQAEKQELTKKQKEERLLKHHEAVRYEKLPRREDARSANLRKITDVGEIEGVEVGETVVYYYGRSLAEAREKGNTKERRCKLDYLANELLRRSTSDSIWRNEADVSNMLASGTGEFQLSQEAVKGTELIVIKEMVERRLKVVKYYYLAKRLV